MEKRLPTLVLMILIISLVGVFLSALVLLRQRNLAARVSVLEVDARTRDRVEALEHLSRQMAEMLNTVTPPDGDAGPQPPATDRPPADDAGGDGMP